MAGFPHDPDSRFGAWVSLLNRAAQVYFTKVLAPYSIGPGQQAYLLAVQPGESLSQLEIAERLSMDKANVARGVQALVKAGYFQRLRPEDDRRRWSVSLTTQGREVREEIEAHMKAWVSGIRKDIPPDEWPAFVSTLSRIATRAMEHAAEAGETAEAGGAAAAGGAAEAGGNTAGADPADG